MVTWDSTKRHWEQKGDLRSGSQDFTSNGNFHVAPWHPQQTSQPFLVELGKVIQFKSQL